MREEISKLEINSLLYEAGLDYVKTQMRRDVESCLRAIERVSAWASCHHPGRFADGALENYALEAGRMQEEAGRKSDLPYLLPGRSVSRTLHVATRLFEVGGHSRVLSKWVACDSRSEHVVVLTDQREKVPDLLQQIITRSLNTCICLPIKDSIAKRAAAVRKLSQSCDRVVLHTHSHDSIPAVAFAKEGGPPVAMFNHAHYSFNLSSTVSDMIINTLEYFRNISERYRFAKSTSILSLESGLWSSDDNVIDKEYARRKLSIPEKATVIMSMAVEHYYRPMEGYNFFNTARKILNEMPDSYLMIVGIKKGSSIVPEDLNSNNRFLLMGYVENPIVHYQASDIVLESFPMPSLGAVSEAIIYGEAYPVTIYGPGEGILRVQRPPFEFHYRAPDEKSYVEYVMSLARNKEGIRAEARKMRMLIKEHEQLFENRLCSLNRQIDALKHVPGEIPIVKKIESDDCRTLAELDQSDIGDKIDSLFPAMQSIFHHVGMVQKGYQSREIAIQRILKRVKLGLSRMVS